MGAEDARAAAAAARAARRRQRSAGARPARAAGLRPRNGVAARHHAGDDRSDAVRLVRPAPGLDDVHAAQSVPRDPRGRSRSSSRTRSTCATLFIRSGVADAERRRRRRRRHRRRRHARHAAGAAARRQPRRAVDRQRGHGARQPRSAAAPSASATAFPNGNQVPLQRASRTSSRRRRRSRSTTRAVPGRHAVVQPRAGRVARRGGDRGRTARRTTCRCRPASRDSSRDRPRRSRTR